MDDVDPPALPDPLPEEEQPEEEIPAGKFFAVRKCGSLDAGAVFLSYEDAQKHCATTLAGSEYLVRGFEDLGEAAKFASEGEVDVLTSPVAASKSKSKTKGGKKRKSTAASAASAGGTTPVYAGGKSSSKKQKKKKAASSGAKQRTPRKETGPRKPYKQWEQQFAVSCNCDVVVYCLYIYNFNVTFDLVGAFLLSFPLSSRFSFYLLMYSFPV